MARNCAKCGAPLKNDDVICMNCGAVAEEAADTNNAGLKLMPVEGAPSRQAFVAASDTNQADLKLRPVGGEPSRQGLAAAADTRHMGMKTRPTGSAPYGPGANLEETQMMTADAVRAEYQRRKASSLKPREHESVHARPQNAYREPPAWKMWGLRMLLVIVALLLGWNGYMLSHDSQPKPVEAVQAKAEATAGEMKPDPEQERLRQEAEKAAAEKAAAEKAAAEKQAAERAAAEQQAAREAARADYIKKATGYLYESDAMLGDLGSGAGYKSQSKNDMIIVAECTSKNIGKFQDRMRKIQIDDQELRDEVETMLDIQQQRARRLVQMYEGNQGARNSANNLADQFHARFTAFRKNYNLK